MKTISNLSIFLIGIFLLGCQQDYYEGQAESEKQITKKQIENNTVTLNAEALNIAYPLAPVRSMEYYNNRLYISELSDKDSIVVIIDLKNERKAGYLIQQGDGPGELSFADEISVHDDYLCLVDPYKYRIYTHPVENNRNIIWNPDKLNVIQLRDVFADNLIFIGGEIFTTYYAAEEVARFTRMDASGNLQSYIGELPSHPDSANIDKRITNMIFTVKYAVKPDDERFVLAYEYEDRMEIYDHKANLLYSLKGPDFFHPEFALNDRKNGTVMIRGKTRKSCIKVYATLEEIWTLYSGEVIYPLEEGTENNSHLSDKIFVFDWEGNFIRAYQLDLPVYNFCLDTQNKLIYAVSEENDNNIIKFRY